MSKKKQKNSKSGKYIPSFALYFYEHTTVLPRIILGFLLAIVLLTLVSAVLQGNNTEFPPEEMPPTVEPSAVVTVEPETSAPATPELSPSTDITAPSSPEPSEVVDHEPETEEEHGHETDEPGTSPPPSEPEVVVVTGTPPPADSRTLPIIKLHHLVMDGEEVTGDTITLSRFTELLARLAGAGYTTVSTAELINFVNAAGELPDKPVMITFDDGYASNYTLAYPMLKEFDMKAVISVIGWSMGRFTNNDGISPIIQHVSWQQLLEMQQSGHVETGNHTYNMHGVTYNGSGRAGVLQLESESDEEYETTFKEDVGMVQDLIKENLGVTNKLFCYPYGKGDSKTERMLSEMGFEITLSTTTGVNTIERGGALHQLKREDVRQDTDLAAMIDGW